MYTRKIAIASFILFSILVVVFGITYLIKTKDQNIIKPESSLIISGNQGIPVEHGLSETKTPPPLPEDMQYFLLSGVLLKKPSLQRNGYIKYDLGIENDQGERLNVFVFVDPIKINNADKIGITFVSDPEQVNTIKGIRNESNLFDLDQALSIYDSKVHTQIAFEILVADSSASLETYYRSNVLLDSGCSNNCQRRFDRVIQRLEETYETLNYLKAGDLSV